MSDSQPERLPIGRKPQLYDYDAAAFLTGLSPETIREYCTRGKFVRGVHWILFTYRWRYGRLIRRKRLLTAAGIDFVTSGAYLACNARESTCNQARQEPERRITA